jgi:hypothetical protein
MICFAAVWGGLEFIGKADAEDIDAIPQFTEDAEVTGEVIAGAGEYGNTEAAVIAADVAARGIPRAVAVREVQVVIGDHYAGVKVKVLDVDTREVVSAANADDGIGPFFGPGVPGAIYVPIFKSLEPQIATETDDTGPCFPNAAFVAEAESGALAAVRIAAGERTTETDAAANHIGTGFERLGMNADSGEKGNGDQGDAKKH